MYIISLKQIYFSLLTYIYIELINYNIVFIFFILKSIHLSKNQFTIGTI